MGQISFSLETVHQYKKQELEQVTEEWRALWEKVEQQRQAIRTLEGQYLQNAQRFHKESEGGVSLPDAQANRRYLQRLSWDLERARGGLEQANQAAEAKRGLLVQVKQEISSMDKLKEKRVAEFTQRQQKKEERSLEEFVMHQKISQAMRLY